ncbi:MAG: hypothetical protein ACLP50_20070 [Solirubrobacteraceae bacterium]
MHIPPVSQSPPVTPVTPRQATKSAPQTSGAAVQTSAAAATTRITAANVPPAALKRANGDGDGKTGTAALNDGDAASQAARRQAVDIKA